MHKIIILLTSLLMALAVNAQTMTTITTGPEVLLRTTEGDILVRLYDDTPQHRDNFLKLTREGYYDGMLFHRVINQFMVQTGDPNSKNPDNTQPLGSGDPSYTLPAEINYPKHFHKYGALAAARTADQVNPERRSSGSQFYIVTGRPYPAQQLKSFEMQANNEAKKLYFNNLVRSNMDKIRSLQAAGDTAALESLRLELIADTEANVSDVKMPAEVVEAYTTVGGTPHLDGAYTVFGEVVEGMDVVEKIQKAATDGNDRPLNDIRIISAAIVKE